MERKDDFLKIGKFIFRTRLFENLRMLPHAPGVQMQGMLTCFFCQIKILHLGSFERPYIVSLKKYNYMFLTPVAMETIKDGCQTTFKKIPTPPKIKHREQNCFLNFN